ncbi:hypothetical protein AVEN_155369-1 [Araneus ventricosus]|uniref:Uncharacterized protein n=1 Tax=Araneus ventricosus TaxID=182803 RepID=A0A4Y2MZ95_ARAVE|nr:hypothetical protein AVEN_155369-1 [Araneus ventricosus]
MHPSASLRGSRKNAPIKFPQSGENGVVWPPLFLQHIVYNSDAVDLQVATARTRSCGRRQSCGCEATHDPVFCNGAVHTGATKFCNRLSPRAYPRLPMGSLRFWRRIVAVL